MNLDDLKEVQLDQAIGHLHKDSMYRELDILLAQLSEQRKVVEEYSLTYKEHKALFEKDNEIYLTLGKGALASLHEIESKIKRISLALYESDPGTKDIYRGVKEKDKITYEYNSTTALEWCITHTICLQLDTKGFESYLRSLKTLSNIPGLSTFVKVVKEPTITLPKEI